MGPLPGDAVTARIRIAILLAASLLPHSPSPLLAQSGTTGRITGVVKDQSGAVIAGAKVTVVNGAGGARRSVLSDEAGEYAVPLLPPDAYQVTVMAAGFQTALFPAVRVTITETTTVDAELRVGPVTDSVTVSTQAPLVRRDGPQLGRVIDARGVSELPLATRNFTQILGLSPGAAASLPDNTAVGRNTQILSVNGARMTQNNLQINGIDVNTMGTSAAVNVPIPAPEAIQEFKVQTLLYDATFGRSGGGNIQIVTKSGTNTLRAATYEYLRHDALNANNPFLKAAGLPRPALTRHVFGGTGGGPIRRDRSFFFLSYQGTRERNSASVLNSLSSNVLIAPGLTSDRSERTLLNTFGPTLPDGRRATSIDSTALALLNTKLPSGQFVIPTPQANGRYSGSAPSRFQEDQFNATLDHHLGANNSLAVKAFFANAPSTLVLPSFRGTGPNVPGFGFDQRNDNRVIAVQDVHAFSAAVFNEARIGYTIHRNYFSPEEPVRDSDVGIRRANADLLPGLPLIRIAPAAGGLVIGTPTTIAPGSVSVTTLADTLSITRGRHAIRVGAEMRYNAVDLSANIFTRGQIDFADFKSFLTGTTSFSIFGSGIGDRNLRATDYNVFAQDDWKATPKLTVNLGARYELDLPPYDTLGRLSTFDPSLYQPRPPDTAGNPVGPPLGGFVQAANVSPRYDVPQLPKVDKGVVRSVDPTNIAPRLGFAYSPLDAGQLVVRAGYGLFYSRATFQYVSTSVTVPPTYVLGRNNNGPPLADPFFSVPASDQFPTFVPRVPLSGTVLDRNIRTPYFHQYSGSVQYEWAKNLLLEVAYVGTQGRHLFRQVAINQARLASAQHPVTNDVTGEVITTNTFANTNLRAPFQGVSINGFSQNQSTAQSSYNSLQVSLTQRFSHGLQFLAAYTYAKSIDNGSGQGGGAGITGVVNPGGVGDTGAILGNQLADRANRGVSDFDRTHRFVLSYVWDLPPPPRLARSAALRLLLADWQISGIATAMSGLPIDIVDTGAGSFYGLAGGGAPLARPNVAPGDSCGAATRDVPAGYFFNPVAFARPTVLPGQPIPSSGGTAIAGDLGADLGDVGRNCLRGPGQSNVDLAIAKRFRLREARHVEVRAEFFNLLNHVNFANPISDLEAVNSSRGSLDPNTGRIIKPGDFGRIISTSNNPRLIQLVLKFSF